MLHKSVYFKPSLSKRRHYLWSKPQKIIYTLHYRWGAFVKNNFEASIALDILEGYIICVSGKDEAKSLYIDDLCITRLSLDVEVEELGNAVINAFNEAEEIYNSSMKNDKEIVERGTIELLSGEKVSYDIPQVLILP